MQINSSLRKKLLKQQGHVCAICQQPRKQGKTFQVDHDHTTGLIRGLLCPACNCGLGCFGDDPDRLRLAAEYLEAKSTHVPWRTSRQEYMHRYYLEKIKPGRFAK